MEVFYQVKEINNFLAKGNSFNDFAFIPTMGNLHEGHLSLIKAASSKFNNIIVSIFINPAQFGKDEDFDRYPRTREQDIEIIKSLSCVDVIFIPSKQELYPFGVDGAAKISIDPLSRELCGSTRHGHFEGVLTVVLRLLNLFSPKAIYLGKKDYQQYILIKQMVADLFLDIEVHGCPIIRADGLALSSRNQYLANEEQEKAKFLNKYLVECSNEIRHCSERGAVNLICDKYVKSLASKGLVCEYLELRSAENLSTIMSLNKDDLLVLLAAIRIGRTRLIDNVEFSF